MRLLIGFVGVAAALFAVAAVLPFAYRLLGSPTPELPPPGRRVEVASGVGVNVLEQGTGRPIVLVHGHPGTAYDWRPLMTSLAARGFRAIAYDRVGYGRSDARPDDDFSLDANASELLGFLETEGLDDAIVVGWSYGGATAITAAKRDASRISRLVLVCSLGPGIEQRDPVAPEWMVPLGRPLAAWLLGVPPLRDRVLGVFAESALAPEVMTERREPTLPANLARPHTLRTVFSEGFDLDGRVDLDPEPIPRPILVVHGDRDRLAPVSIARTLAERARDAELWLVPGGGHALPVTRPERLADRIADFAAKPAPPAVE